MVSDSMVGAARLYGRTGTAAKLAFCGAHEMMQPGFVESSPILCDCSISWTMNVNISLTFCTEDGAHKRAHATVKSIKLTKSTISGKHS